MNARIASTLQVTWDDGGLAASADRAPIVVGRAAGADVQLANRMVSRTHLRLSVENGLWVAVDESSHGTYDAAGGRVERTDVGPEELVLHLGAPDGPSIRLVSTPAIGDGTSAPVVPPIDAGASWTVATTDPTLRLELGGREQVFTPPGRVVVGRGDSSDVVSDNGLVSREHVAFTNEGKGWSIEDLGSSRGTYVDGQRLRKRQPARGAFVAMLGAEDAGEPLRVVTAGAHKKPRRKGRVVASVATVVVAALVAAGVAVAVRDDADDRPSDIANTEGQLDRAARSTVRIFALDEELEVTLRGSGVVLNRDGLILTNAHVADPLAWGIDFVDDDPEGFGIAVVSDRSRPARVAYFAELVAVHPTVDAALIRIVADEDGEPVRQIDTAVLRVGDSGLLKSGTPAHQLGFPGLAGTEQISIAEVSVQSFRPLFACSDLPPERVGLSCSAGARVEGGLVNIAGAQLGGGSSGGPFARKGKLVAINVGRFLGESGPDQQYAIPIHTLDEFLTENGVRM